MSFDVDRYLARIRYAGPHQPSLAALTELQAAHLVHVPFENLHVFYRVGVRVDVEWSFHKIVEQQRGGWCFELNGCFAELLRRLGYAVDLSSCRTLGPEKGGLSADFDHLTLLVHLDGTPYLVDVGWGDNPLTPLPAESGEYASRPRPTRIETDASTVRLIEYIEREDGRRTWELQYEASGQPRKLAEFDARSRYLQTEPGLSWTEKPARDPGHVRARQPGDLAPRSAPHARRRPVDSRHACHRRAMGRGAPHLVRAVRPAMK